MLKKTENAIKARGFKVYGSYVMIENELYPLPLVKGNSKLGLNIWHASTLPTNKDITAYNASGDIITERGTCPLTCEGCYGDDRGRYKFNDTKYSLIMRTRLLRLYPATYFMLVKIQLENENIDFVRIHATGDFITGEALLWYDTLKEFPHVKAWTYTKVKENDEIRLLNSLDNCNIVKSCIPGYGFNFGHNAYIASMYYALQRAGKKVYICRCGIDENQHCSDCTGCSKNEYVLFLEHSTGYKPENDYGFNKIVALIESQEKQ